MDSFPDKYYKDKINEALHNSLTSDQDDPTSTSICDESLDASDALQRESSLVQSVERIKDIFQKTEAMREVAKEKNHQIEEQFKDLKQKLSSSSEYLIRIKKSIENLKFSYQKNVLEINNKIDPGSSAEPIVNPEDFAQRMEDIKKKIDDLQNRAKNQRERQRQVTESYQEAFDNVVNTLQEIESGSYSSQLLNVELNDK